MFLLYLTSQRI